MQAPQQVQQGGRAGQGGGFQGVVQPGSAMRAPGAPEASQGGGNALDRYGPARRRRLMADPLVVGGVLFGKDGGLDGKTVGGGKAIQAPAAVPAAEGVEDGPGTGSRGAT